MAESGSNYLRSVQENISTLTKLKIGILGTRGIPNQYGGFEQFAEQLSQGLVQRGHEVSVYNSSLHPYKESNWNGVNIIHCKDKEDKWGTAGQFIYDRNCNRDARKRNYDVLLHLGYSSDSIWHRIWPKDAVNIVNMDGLEWKRTKYNRITRNFLKRAEFLAARHADTMIADSTAMQEYLFRSYKKKPVFIPYGATFFNDPDPMTLQQFNLKPFEYFVNVARLEPENNVEMVIDGYLKSGHHYPLIIVGSTNKKTGRYLTRHYDRSNIVFVGPVYEQGLLNNIRHYSFMHFHGHSVGGTNPSLLEAMACGCRIAAHDNIFNKAVLQDQADYFSSADDIAAIINKPVELSQIEQRRSLNKEKIQTIYDPVSILNAYEELILKAAHK